MKKIQPRLTTNLINNSQSKKSKKELLVPTEMCLHTLLLTGSTTILATPLNIHLIWTRQFLKRVMPMVPSSHKEVSDILGVKVSLNWVSLIISIRWVLWKQAILNSKVLISRRLPINLIRTTQASVKINSSRNLARVSNTGKLNMMNLKKSMRCSWIVNLRLNWKLIWQNR